MSIPVRLVLASTLMLFLELSLIRWSGAQVVHLSYFSNFILLGSFLGIGLGFLRANRSKRRQPFYSIVALLAYVGFLSTFPVAVNRDQESVIYFTSLSTSGPPIWVTLPVIFLAVAAIMAGPGELVADCFSQLPRLDAYRCDLIGSLIGIAGFTVCAFTGAPPLVWFLLVATLFVVLLAGAGRIVTITLLAATVAMFAYPLINATGVFWSPYYRVTTFAQSDGNNGTQWQIYVNGIPHQRLTTAATRLEQEPFYDEPYRRVTKPPEQVLIVGAGTGTDVSIALSHGVTQVDAVEIDPRLLRFGREHNPDRAYDDPRVTTYVNDGRAFLERTDKKYDLILFALPDSLTLVSGASALRLESYLFTEEAIQSAREHLAPGGAFSMYNYYREQWLVDRLGNTLATTFGHSPCLLSSPQAISLAVFVVGATPADQRCETTWAPTGTPPQPSTDDRPFLYVQRRHRVLGHPDDLSGGDRLDHVVQRAGHRSGRRGGSGPNDVAIPRSVPAGSCLPVAGDQERHGVRALLRHHVAGERAGLRRRAGRRARGGRDHPTLPYAAVAAHVRRSVRQPGPGLAGAGLLGALAAVRPRGWWWRSCWPSCRSWPRTSSSLSASSRAPIQ